MTLQERFERVLRTHGIISVMPTDISHGKKCRREKLYQQLLKDLEACILQVTREQIESILDTWIVYREDTKSSIVPSGSEISLTVERHLLTEAILALYRGEDKRKWCLHIRWDESEKGKWDCRWKYSTPDPLTVWVPPSWKSCPTCGTPKPQETPDG